MAVTLSQIAEQVGVSVPVVSQVLNPGRSSTAVSESTRNRVLEVSRRLGYRPNVAARALKNRSFRSIGLLIAGAEDRFFLPQEVLMGISRTLAPHRYSCVLVSAGKLDEQNIADQQMLSEHGVDALLVGYADDPPPALVRIVKSLTVPTVWLFRRFPSNCVVYDERRAAEMLMDHLAERGYGEAAYFDLNAAGRNAPHTRDRLDGFHAAAGRLHMKVTERVDQRVPRAERTVWARELLSQPARKRPRVIITDSCTAAASILGTAQLMGLRVPKDLAIASFDNGSLSSVTSPGITAVVTPERSLGIAAAEMAMTLIEQQGPALPPAVLPYTLSVGGTT